MPEFRTRSRSVSIPSSSTSSFNTFRGDGHSRSGSSEQVSFPSVHTTPNGYGTTNDSGSSSHWKALSSHFRPSRTRSMAVHTSRTPEGPKTADTPERRQRAIVRKSLRLPEASQGNVQKPLPPRPKLEEIDSDDEGTLVSVSGGEISSQSHVTKEKQVVEDSGPAKAPLRVSNKILTFIPDIFEDEHSKNERSSQQEVTVPYTGKSLHWGLRSSPYQPEFVIEKEDEKEVQAPVTSLSPPPSFLRRHSTAAAPRR